MILILNTYMVKITMQERFSFVLLKSVHDLLHVLTRTCSVHHSQRRTELDRTDDMVYHNVMEMVKVVVQLKNDVNTLPASEYVTVVKVGRLWTLFLNEWSRVSVFSKLVMVLSGRQEWRYAVWSAVWKTSSRLYMSPSE